MAATLLVPKFSSFTPSYRLSVLEDDAEIGHVYVYIIGDPVRQDKYYALIDDLAVLESGRGKGYGRALMEATKTLASKKRCYKVVANSHRKRKAARALYLSMGFLAHGREFRLNL